MTTLSEVLDQKNKIIEAAKKFDLPTDIKLFHGEMEMRSWLNLVFSEKDNDPSYWTHVNLLATYLEEIFKCQVHGISTANFSSKYSQSARDSLIDINLDNQTILSQIGGNKELTGLSTHPLHKIKQKNAFDNAVAEIERLEAAKKSQKVSEEQGAYDPRAFSTQNKK